MYLKQGMVQHDLFAAGASPADSLAAALRALDEAADDSVAAVRARAARYAALRREASPERAKFDLWTAAFFQPLTPANAPYVPTSKDLIDFNPAGEKALMAAPLAEDVEFFHWELEFPQVFGEAGGFDVVLGNPPWERIKLQEQEHFVDVPAIAGAANKAARDKAIAAWRQGDERQRTRIALFDAAKYRSEAESRFVRASERFPLTAVGDVNTYALFSEHSRNLLAPTGRAGIIVPTGIVTDDTTKAFFADLVTKQTLARVLGFENEEFLFPEINNRTKFCALVVSGVRTQVAKTDFVFHCRHPRQLEQMERHFELSSKDIALLNPNTKTCPVFRTKRDAEITLRIHEQVPIIRNDITNKASWALNFLRMLDMANDSGLFIAQEYISRRDGSLNGMASSSDERSYLPLYEAKMIWQFDHRYASLIGRDNAGTRVSRKYEGWYGVQPEEPDEYPQPQYWVPVQEVEARLSSWKKNWMLGFRDICRAGDERTGIFSLLPRVGVAHTAPLILTDISSVAVACFLGSINSITVDFILRQKLGGTHLTYTILNQLPILPLDRFTPNDITFIVPRVVELVYTAWDIRAFAEDVWAEGDEALRADLLRRNAECNAGAPAELFSPRDGFPLPPFRWDDGRRALARAELDARIARLYGLTRDELRYILDPADVYGPDFPGETFRVLKEKETKQLGEYRTRRLVLEAWDREEQGR